MYLNKENNITPENLDLETTKKYLRVDHDLDDVEISIYLEAAKSYVKDYVKLGEEEVLDYALIIPMLSYVAHCYENKAVNIKSTEKIDAMFKGVLDMYRRDIL